MSQDLEAPANLILNVGAGYDMDRDALDSLTRQLRSELLDLEVESGELIHEGEPPEGAKSADAVTLGELAVAVLPNFLPKLVEYLQSWSLRAEGRKVKVKTQVGDRSIELEYTPEALSLHELQKLVETLTGALKDDQKGE
jgi:hypothetical protein